ncbi:DUF2235 domain-containing protein [Gloeothece verrucosa]|uniref:T6SS Phospholipase effector Tle1-like catalytic domain-containing protein n=1 Tax=Gloeothece verrucosa (strain PCC 7822) TaxID=497965 RepID=E0UJ98_GLOV7|nr:DUF2235 domain-containing protein [Gloeothece verrucosa]ADN15801.1 Protein of unknown function DUF2235 [Gloeothece verrucosa PCC 7822]
MKRLIVCCDGTWETLTNPTATNVVKIAQGIKSFDDKGIAQIVYYEQGVGTGEDFINKIGGGAFGWGIDQAIQTSYRFLCLNYDPGDEIYLFGFSRGAYTVRSLSGFIFNCGLIERRYIREIPKAYEFYRDRRDETRPSSDQAVKFRQQYGQNNGAQIPITLLGCWDTVGSLGIPDVIPYFPLDNWINQKYLFHDTQLHGQTVHARHAVAVDEIRSTFNVTPMDKAYPEQDIKQIWFPGEHGCVGGGTAQTQGLSDRALQWMIEEAVAIGLGFDVSRVEGGIKLDHTVNFNNEPQGVFKLAGTIHRKIDSFNNLDDSVKKRWRDRPDYRSKNLKPFESQLNDWSTKNPRL